MPYRKVNRELGSLDNILEDLETKVEGLIAVELKDDLLNILGNKYPKQLEKLSEEIGSGNVEDSEFRGIEDSSYEFR